MGIELLLQGDTWPIRGRRVDRPISDKRVCALQSLKTGRANSLSPTIQF